MENEPASHVLLTPEIIADRSFRGTCMNPVLYYIRRDTLEKDIKDYGEQYSQKYKNLLTEIATDLQAKYDAEFRSAIIHNNMDGVGIHFDYMAYPAKPKYLDQIHKVLNLSKNG